MFNPLSAVYSTVYLLYLLSLASFATPPFTSGRMSLQQIPVNNFTLAGQVVSAESGLPVPFASVFLASTSYGTVTDEKGFFQLRNLPLGRFELMVSYIGYVTHKESITVEADQLNLRISLQTDQQRLAEITVTAKKDRKWQRQYKLLEATLLGATANTGACTIDNPWVINFSTPKNSKRLLATASAPIEVTNKSLGYKLFFYLQSFESDGKQAVYVGDTRFENLKPATAEEQQRWEKNREQTYKGSLRHFLYSFIHQQWEQQGFQVYKVVRESYTWSGTSPLLLKNELDKNLQPLSPQEVLQQTGTDGVWQMQFDGKIVMIYTRKPATGSPYKDAPYAVTFLKMNEDTPLLNSQGWLYNPTSLLLTGHLAKEGVADMLPYEYMPALGADGISTDSTKVAMLSQINRITGAFEKFTSGHATQKVYLHTNLPYYLAGDTLWFSTYLSDASSHRLLDTSQVVYVELLSPAQTLVLRQKQPTQLGRGSGYIALPDTLSKGDYTLAAYTGRMRNFDNAYFFRATVPVLNRYKEPAHPLTSAKPVQADFDVTFFPEGGNLVAGLTSRLAFKAIQADAKGTYVSGSIVDEQGREAATFESAASGMGSVLFTPEKGKTYTALCKKGEQLIRIPLPGMLEEGLVLSVAQIAMRKLLINISASAAYQDQRFFCIAQTRGKIHYTVNGQLKGGSTFFEIPTFSIPEGICQLTFFDAKGTPLCERLVFIQSPAAGYQLSLKTEDRVYEPGEQVNLEIQVSDPSGQPLESTFSVSVTDAGIVKADSLGSNILSYLLLSSDLKGEIENPGQYFADRQPTTLESLDMLMLTQGWRRFSWQQVVPGEEKVLTYPAEYGLTLSGKVVATGYSKQEIASSRITLLPLDAMAAGLQTTQLDANGRFKFSDVFFINGAKVAFEVTDSAGRKMYAKVTLDEEMNDSPASQPRQVLQASFAAIDADLEKKIRRSLTQADIAGDKILKEVVVKGKKIRPPAPREDREQASFFMPDAVIKVDDRLRSSATIYDLINSGRVAGVRADAFTKTVTIRGGRPLIVIDGVPMSERDNSALDIVTPAQVERIDILKNVQTFAVYGLRAGNVGVIAIFTRMGTSASSLPKEAIYTLPGYDLPREFYVPVYQASPSGSDQINVINLYWNPILDTDEEGKAKVSFYSMKPFQSFQLLIEGISATGQPFVHRQIMGGKK